MGVRGDMESGGSLHRARNGESSMVYAAHVLKTPLLPFEKQLIESIGATEEEYRYLVAEVLRRGNTRPAGYENIPDIQATGVEIVAATFWTNLAVGLTLMAISYLLTPKPKGPRAQERRELESINNAGRFSPTFGFDSQAELANYGASIPIIFSNARYDASSNYVSGGILVSPKMVWSRMQSYGTQQGVKLAFVVGEEGTPLNGIEAPLLSGVFIGNNPLDDLYRNAFAFYWRRHTHSSPGSRVQIGDLKYGSRGSISSGDPDTHQDILICPTSVENDTGFSSAYSLSNSTEFGCYAPIPNGSIYRVNWRIISMIGDNDNSDALAWERIKIAGTYSKGEDRDNILKGHDHEFHTDGTGRNYSRRMGILYYHRGGAGGSGITASDTEVVKIIDDVQVDDVCEFHIMPSDQNIRKDIYHSGKNTNVSVEDINSEINSQREAADDALQVGELYKIGYTTWVVYHRDIKIWKSDPKTGVRQKIWLRCIDNGGGGRNKIGIVSQGVVWPESSSKFGEAWVSDSLDATIEKEPGANFFPLMRVSQARIKNNRACSSTELGIRSRVFQDLSGLCNFQSLPTPDELHKLEDNEIAVQSGTITTSIRRASLFNIRYRDAEVNWTDTSSEKAENRGWKVLNSGASGWQGYFCVVGTRPVDQYNSIRIKHPEEHRYEFQIVPLPGAAMNGAFVDKDTEVYLLSASDSQVTLSSGITDGFSLSFNGSRTTRQYIQKNREFFTNAVDGTLSTTFGKPTDLSMVEYIPESKGYDDINQIAELEHEDNWGGVGSGADGTDQVTGYGRGGAIGWELFGDPGSSSTPVNGTKTVTFRDQTSLDKDPNADGSNDDESGLNLPVKISFTARRVVAPGLQWQLDAGITHNWVLLGANVNHPGIGASPVIEEGEATYNMSEKWTVGKTFKIYKTCQAGNKYAENAENKDSHGNSSGRLNYVGYKLKVKGIKEVDNVVRGREDGFLDEVFGTDSSSIHALRLNDTKEVEIQIKDGAMTSGWKSDIDDTSKTQEIKLKFSGKVVSISGGWTGRYRGWKLTKAPEIIASGTNDKWSSKSTFTLYRSATTIDASNKNIFWDGATMGQLGATFRIDELDVTETASASYASREFEGQSQYSDISLYGNLVRKANESSPEHICTYVNEFKENRNPSGDSFVPKYKNITTAVLSLKASRNFSGLDQMRVWLKEGIRVENLHPDESSAIQASNLFTDLVYYLFTNRVGGVGRTIGETSADVDKLVNKEQLIETSKFLKAEELFFDGAIDSSVNVRNWVAGMAAHYLCDFILADGRFSLKPALPVTSGGDISTGAIEIKQLFTSGNILEDSFKLEYIEADERRDFEAIVRYRGESENQLPEERTISIRRSSGAGVLPTETFDLTDCCTTKNHAVKVGKYFLSLRHHVKHTCSFRTTPHGLNLAPGDYIRVTTETSPYNAAKNGTISATGEITSISTINDGTYDILYYSTSTDEADVEKTSVRISSGSIPGWAQGASIFSLVETVESQNVYRVEQISLDQENIVEIVASEFPCNSDSVSLIAKDVKEHSFVIN